jgi:hypothetical protein
MQTRTLYGIIALLVAIVLVLSTVAVYYSYEYNQELSVNQTYAAQLKELNVKYISDILIDYGNGTFSWYNNTKVQPGWNLYTGTLVATNGNVNSTCCEFGSHLVFGLNGVQSTSTIYWWIWTYNSTSSWEVAPTGADELLMYNGSVYGWTFCGSTPSGNPTCAPH